jgi:hypothetical protein
VIVDAQFGGAVYEGFFGQPAEVFAAVFMDEQKPDHALLIDSRSMEEREQAKRWLVRAVRQALPSASGTKADESRHQVGKG